MAWATTWTAASGDWASSENWSDGVPAADVDATFDRTDAYTVTLTSASPARDLTVLRNLLTLSTAGQTLSARDLTVSDSAVMGLSGGGIVQQRNARIGKDGGVGTVAVSGIGSTFGASGLVIGSGANSTTLVASRGTLGLSVGATVYNTDAVVGENGGVGELTINGTHTTFNGENVYIGSAGGVGSVKPGNGGALGAIRCYIGYNGGGNALVEAGARLDTSGTTFGILSVGSGVQSADSGLTINAGGTVKSSLMQIGCGTFGAGGVGTVTISGANATLTVSTLAVGRSSDLNAGGSVGTGTLDIGVGGVVNVANALVLSTGNGDASTSGGVVNLMGGTLAVASIQQAIANNGSPATGGRVNFFGGTIRAAGNLLLIYTPITLSGAGTIDTDGHDGSVSGTISDGTIAGSTFTKSGLGTLALTGANTYTGTTTVTNGTLQVSTVAAAVLLAGSGTTGGGTDVRNGSVVFTGGDVVAIRGLLAGGFHDPTTDGVMDSGTLRSSTATPARGLGYADTDTAVIVKATLFGDADLDGGVSINDFNALAGNFGQSSGRVWTDGDFDYDGGVSINDFNLLAGNFGQTLPASRESWAGLLAFAAAHNDLAAFEAATGVPEPSLAVLVGGLAIGRRRRA